MRKTLKYGESWELATLKVATLLVGNVGTRSQFVRGLSKHEYMFENHYSRSIRTKVMNKTRKYAQNS